jgi:hypothetical protein
MYPVLANWMIVHMTVTKNILSYFNIGSYRAIVKYEGQRPNYRLGDDESHFSNNTCPKIRRNREAVVEKTVVSLSKKDVTIPKEQPTNIPEKVQENQTISPEAVLKDMPSGENDTIEIDSETNDKETTETENERPIISPEIPPGQIPPLHSSPTVIPEI